MIKTIYIEKQIKNHFRTKKILSRFKDNVNVILCDHYGEIFNIKSQNFRIQKTEPALIIAKKKEKRFYKFQKILVLGETQIIIFLIC